MRVSPAAVAVPFLLLLLTWLLLSGLNLNSSLFDRELRALDDFAMIENALHRDVLTARAGLLRHYGSLVSEIGALHDALDRLRKAAAAHPEEKAAIDRLAALVDRQEELVEQFKSKNALLQNSLAYFGLFSARLATSDRSGPLVAAASTLAAAMLHLTLNTSPATALAVEERLDEFATLRLPPGDAESVRALLAHGRMLHDLLPTTDAVLKSLFAVATDSEQEAVRSLVVARQLAARASARQYRLLLYVTSLLLLGVLVHLGLRLRARALALQRRAEFEHVIARISTRFINSQHYDITAHVEWALGELAACIGADRAYFVTAGNPMHVYRWCRKGAEFPLGWPERALGLASNSDQGEDGTIHIQNINHSARGDGMDVLAAAGLHSWLCISSTGGRDAAEILGFDALQAGALSRWNEFGLFRMAFDAIANAVSREVLEQEKERLEASLHQARRMETIGALTSGIAHNFNNIVGAILGFTEMAHAYVKAGSRPANSLGEIRRAGERARDLVDQILTFGRRGAMRRERICVKGLIAETRTLLEASLPRHIGLMIQETSETTIVAAEPAQLQQVILNVCNNAAQAMDETGTIEIMLEARETESALRMGHDDLAAGRYAIISIIDTGRGMDEATRERIFEPFFTTRRGGNGLGLATVREIVRQHGGAVSVQSSLGAGTRFDIWLPCAPPVELAPGQTAFGPTGRGCGETVLVLEMDRERLLRHEEILAALGYEPVGFTLLVEAVEACRRAQARFDAALVCPVHGTTSALDLAAAVHKIAPSLPIILATASSGNFDAPSLAAAGISELIHHPLSSAELAGALTRCLAMPVPSLRHDRSPAAVVDGVQ
jgi:signal transduction histidine kinase